LHEIATENEEESTMNPITKETATTSVRNIEVTPLRHRLSRADFALSPAAAAELDSWLEPQLEMLEEKYAHLQTPQSMKTSLGR